MKIQLAETYYSDAKLNKNQDIFYQSQVIHEPEYFLNLTANSQEQQFQLANQEILEVAYQNQKNQKSSLLRHLNLKYEIQQNYTLDKLETLNHFDYEYDFNNLQQDSLSTQQQTTFSSQILEDKFYKSKYSYQFVSNLEQISTQPIQCREFQIQEKNYKNQNILKDIFNSFHKYFKNVQQFPVCEFQNVDLKDVKKKFNRFVKVHSFNNSIIKYFLTHKFYKILFTEYYEKGHLDQWISKSKCNNKNALKYWANYLIACSKTPSYLENLIVNPIQKNKKKNIKN